MNPLLIFGVAVLAVIALALAAFASVRQWRWRRRERALHHLLEAADRLETDLKLCREQLNRAHKSMAVAPGLPTPRAPEARAAVDDALRDLLSHRLWIRDCAATASQGQIDEAIVALDKAHARIQERLASLDSAQEELDAAVRERLNDIAES